MSIKELRERTQAGLADCKKAWEESNGNMDVAIKLLREKGLAKAIKRAGMEASEGAVVIANNGTNFGMVFFGTETDFVAKNDEFCNFANSILKEFVDSDVVDIKTLAKDGTAFEERVAYLSGVIGENIVLKGACKMTKDAGTSVFAYLHNKLNDNFENVGKIGAMIKVKGEFSEDTMKMLTMHLASFKPSVMKREQLSQEWLDAQKAEVEVSGETLESRIKGATLEEQSFLLDSSLTFKAYCEQNGIEVVDFKVFSIR